MASSRKMRRGLIGSCPSKVLTALCVAYFALTGLAMRVGIYLLLKKLDFGVTTNKAEVPAGPPGEFGPFSEHEYGSHRCRMEASSAGYFVQNIVGCILMAAIARHKKLMNEHMAAGLGSGLCGSLTTFATWMGEQAATFNNGFVWQGFISFICMLCVSICSYKFGHYISGCGMGDEVLCPDLGCCVHRRKRGDAAAPAAPPSRPAPEPASSDESGDSSADEESGESDAGPRETLAEAVDEAEDWDLAVDTASSWREAEPPKELRLSIGMHWAIFGLAGVISVAYIALSASLESHGELLFDIAMAPFGALLRWYLSLFNPLTAPFPLFTLVANLVGCGANGIAGVWVARMAASGDSKVAIAAVAAVSTGFAGCLSTVSTLVAELRSDALGGLRVRCFYALLSFGLAMAILLPIDRASC